MKRNIRYNSKYLNEIKRIIIEHINSNVKDYLTLSIIFVLGVMIGVVVINNSTEQSKNEIVGYIGSFVDTIKNSEYEIDKIELIKLSVFNNLKIVAIVWIAGSTIIGIPLIYLITLYKGFRIGYTISAIILSLGTGKRYFIFVYFLVFAKYYYNTNIINVEC